MRKRVIHKPISQLLLLANMSCAMLSAQNTANKAIAIDGSQGNFVRTAAPFLRIAPDTRSAAMGNVGLATAVDANSIFWNSAKYAFAQQRIGLTANYTPWLRKVVKDVKLLSLAGFYQLNPRHTLATGLRYFSWGEVNFTDESGNYLQLVKPHELAIDVAYAYQVAPYLSLSLTPKFIYSRLGVQNMGYDYGASQAFALDLGAYAHHPLMLGNAEAKMAYGLSASNIGQQMTYGLREQALPRTLRLGSSLAYPLDSQLWISYSLDINRPLLQKDNTQTIPVKEIKKYSLGTGIELDYDEQLALRAGYYYGSTHYGERSYMTTGAAFAYQPWNFGLAYIIPTSKSNPLANTLRFSLSYTWEN